MKALKDNHTAQGVIGGIVLLIGVGVYYYFKGKSATKNNPIPPDTGNVGQERLKEIADGITKDITSFSMFGHEAWPYQAAVALSNADLTKLYNLWNITYQQEYNQTMYVFIDHDLFTVLTDAGVAVQSLLDRMVHLNLG